MKCPNCENEIENGSMFCEHCGTRIKKSKEGLWITLSIIILAVMAAIIVVGLQEQQEQMAKQKERMLQRQLELEELLKTERKAREEAERKAQEEVERQVRLNAERKAREEAERKARERAARKAELVRQGYIDLGLPSGTLWRNSNEDGDYARYTYNEAVRKFGDKLPTKKQLEELINKCTWSCTSNSYKVIGPNGNFIVLPIAGVRNCDGDVSFVDRIGIYWSSSLHDSDHACTLICVFSSDRVTIAIDSSSRCYGYSVRLVQNP